MGSRPGSPGRSTRIGGATSANTGWHGVDSVDDVEVVREVTDTIQAALKRNRRIETILLTLLSGIGLTGLGFLVSALSTARWELAVSGGIVELAILMPIRE